MNTINQFLEDNARRLLEITPTSWIKRVYTENGVLFECEEAKKGKETRLNAYGKKSDVLQWYKSL